MATVEYALPPARLGCPFRYGAMAGNRPDTFTSQSGTGFAGEQMPGATPAGAVGHRPRSAPCRPAALCRWRARGFTVEGGELGRPASGALVRHGFRALRSNRNSWSSASGPRNFALHGLPRWNVGGGEGGGPVPPRTPQSCRPQKHTVQQGDAVAPVWSLSMSSQPSQRRQRACLRPTTLGQGRQRARPSRRASVMLLPYSSALASSLAKGELRAPALPSGSSSRRTRCANHQQSGWQCRATSSCFSCCLLLLAWLQSTISVAGSLAASRSLAGGGHAGGVVVRVLPPRKITWQSLVAVGVHDDGHLAVLVHRQEVVAPAGRLDGVGGDADVAVRAVLEADGADGPSQLAVHLAFGGARTNGAPGDQVADVLGRITSRNSLPAGMPRRLISISSWRCACAGLRRCGSFREVGSLMRPFQPTVVRGFSKYTRITISSVSAYWVRTTSGGRRSRRRRGRGWSRGQ